MQCLYCGKPLGLLRELADSEFCSRDHRHKYRSLTKRAFSRLMQSRPEPVSFRPAPSATPELPRLPEAAPPLASAARRPAPWPPPRAVPARSESAPAGPFFQFYTMLIAPEMSVHAVEGTLALACPRPLQQRPTASLKGAALAAAEPTHFRQRPVRMPAGSFDISPIEGPCEAFGEAIGHRPSAEPALLPPRLQEAAIARVPTNGVTYCQPARTPALPAYRPAPAPREPLPCARPVPMAARTSLPAAQPAGGPEPLTGPIAPVTTLLRAALERVSEAALPLATGPRPAACAAQAVAASPAEMAFPVRSPRLPGLNAAFGRLLLKAGEKAFEEVSGADVASLPATEAVKPGLGTGSVLPALASLFRYSREAKASPALPHLTDGLSPHNRQASPVAFKELPMPAQHPRVPRSSGLHIVETFEYLRPLEEPAVDFAQNLVRLWNAVPAYFRYAAAAACVILLVWAAVPGRALTGLFASRWGLVQEQIEQRAAIEMTEDFRDDMSQWSGSGEWAQSWRISNAGYARPGRLALYEPSMGMRDYNVEFLMQIEQRAVGFAYRATDRDNFYAAKISVVKAGSLPVLSLVRYPVIGGREGQKVEVPIRLMLHNNTPYRVQMTIKGRNFSTSIEGQLVDFWTDDRLQAGGFGFFSDTGESARVYWMKLSHQNDFVGRVCAYIRQPALPRKRTEVHQ